ncbi:MAG: bile acid:sodium symporter family protein [Bacteroidota bacterium]
MTQSLEVLDTEFLNFSEASLMVMNITLAFIMFGVALSIKIGDFKNIIKNPRSLLTGIVSQFIFLPAVSFLFITIIKPPASVALGLILVAACPGGNISNFITMLAKGNIALSISLTSFSTLASIFMTPLNFRFWGSLYTKASGIYLPIHIDPVQMFVSIFLILGVPLIIGMIFARKFPLATEKIKNPMKVLSIIIFAGYVFFALSANFNLFLKYIHLVVVIVLLHNALALSTGFLLASLAKVDVSSRRSISIETGIQNSALALVLIFNPNLFNGLGGMAFIAAWWGIWHILSGLILGFAWSRIPIKRNT